ncbi:MAG TPA: DUF433 domain-containing protein [Pyrinomonadaceae bacterium]|nr:DUF433 domain-containing protein [Pyrinomonadaceae bacterium]
MALVIEAHEITSLPITVDPEIMGGVPVFLGTRVSVDALLGNLEVGVSIDEFLENFPTVSREQVLEVLKFSRATLDRVLKMK